MYEQLMEYAGLYGIIGMLLFLPVGLFSEIMFKDSENSGLKTAVVVALFGGPFLWLTVLFLLIISVIIGVVGTLVDKVMIIVRRFADV